MASSTLPDMVLETEGSASASTPIEHSEAIPIEAPSKPRGKARLLQGLQRISSSPSLAQLGRKRATSNPYGGRGSLSCVSLAVGSPSNYNSYGSQSSGNRDGYSTAPTSVPNTPGLDTPHFDGSYVRIPIRKIESGALIGISTPTAALPFDMRPSSRGGIMPFPATPEIQEDYFSLPKKRVRRANFSFWGELPHEVRLHIFSFLQPKELVRLSSVGKQFHQVCFDGQLWTCFDASEFYKEIPADSLTKIIATAGPFVKDLNLRGCVQVEEYQRAERLVNSCKNLMNMSLEGCRQFQKSTLHKLVRSNSRMTNMDLTGVTAVTNGTCKIIAASCPTLEMLNVSWCTHMDAQGIRTVVQGCPKLKDLRAGEIKGFNDVSVAQSIFLANTLERLVLRGCDDLVDETFRCMIAGHEPKIDLLTEIPIVPTRKLRHLDISRCERVTSQGVKVLAHLVPELEGLQLSACTAIDDSGLEGVFATTPRLTHLDLEDLNLLTNSLFSEHLSKAPCASKLHHLSISYCENIGDLGLLPIFKSCVSLQSIDLDNTKISDLVLAEAASMIRTRSSQTNHRPEVGLKMVIFDCQNVTWTGIREVLSRNSEVKNIKSATTSLGCPSYPSEIISLKCFYGWQMTVNEHEKRVLKGDLPAAARLERKWADYMVAFEEHGAATGNSRRRRRRMRQAQMLVADEEDGDGNGGIGRRRRARSNGCAIM